MFYSKFYKMLFDLNHHYEVYVPVALYLPCPLKTVSPTEINFSTKKCNLNVHQQSISVGHIPVRRNYDEGRQPPFYARIGL